MPTKYSNVSDVPLALAVFLATDSYDHNEDKNTISATALLKPIRQIVLPSRLPVGEGLNSLGDMMASRIGTAIHDGIESAWKNNYKQALENIGMNKNVIDRIAINPKPEELTSNTIPIYLEQRLTRQIGKRKITGKFDFIGEGILQDFKSTSVWTYMYQTNTDKYQQQGSIYRWLDSNLITSDTMQIHFIFTDWKAPKFGGDPKYPTKRFLTQSIPLMNLNDTEKFITNKLNQIDKYWDAPEETIPECTDEELWRSSPIYKYYKNPSKLTRSTKNFDTPQEAYLRLAEDHNVGVVIASPGEVKACKYCPAYVACSQKDKLIASGDLIIN